MHVTWNQDFSNLPGKRKFVQKIWQLEKSGVTFQCSTEGKRLFFWYMTSSCWWSASLLARFLRQNVQHSRAVAMEYSSEKHKFNCCKAIRKVLAGYLVFSNII